MNASASNRNLFAALREARRLLRAQGYPCEVRARDLVRWLRTDTPYPNPSDDEVIRSPYFLAHELIEIREVQRMGLRLTKDVIVKHMTRINDAHLVAARAEFDVAFAAGAWGHLRSRLPDVRGWCRDPLLTKAQRRRYSAFLRAAEARMRREPSGKGR